MLRTILKCRVLYSTSTTILLFETESRHRSLGRVEPACTHEPTNPPPGLPPAKLVVLFSLVEGFVLDLPAQRTLSAALDDGAWRRSIVFQPRSVPTRAQEPARWYEAPACCVDTHLSAGGPFCCSFTRGEVSQYHFRI